jgi:hypothetical protein
MELTCGDPDASSAPSCRLTRFSEFVPNDRIWTPLLLSGINCVQETTLRYATPTDPWGFAMDRDSSEGKAGLTWRNRAKTQVSPKRPYRQFRLHTNGSGFPGISDRDVPVAQKCVMRFSHRTARRTRIILWTSCTPAITHSRSIHLVERRGDQCGFAEAVVSITGRANSDASNLGFT